MTEDDNDEDMSVPGYNDPGKPIRVSSSLMMLDEKNYGRHEPANLFPLFIAIAAFIIIICICCI